MNQQLTEERKHELALESYRPTWIQIDLNAVESNVKKFKNYIGEEVHLMAVVKGNACGSGMLEIAETVIQAGATWIGVATLDEAIVVRSKFKKVPILVFGYVDPQYLNVVSKHKITVTAVSLDWVKKAAVAAKESFDFHLKLDTGLNRLGCRTTTEIEKVKEIVSRSPFLNWAGAFTHFATAEEVDQQYFQLQLKQFNEFLKIIPQRDTKIIHCANSYATLYCAEKPFFNMVRVGRGLYGTLIEKFKNRQPFSLETAFSLHSRLTLVKQLAAAEKIGYFGEYTTTEVQWIGTIPIGYGDGWQAQYKTNTILIEGQRVAVVGRIAMDNLMVALPQSYPVGTLVTLIGKQGAETIVSDEIEDATNQPRNQIFTGMSIRLPRKYIRDGKTEKIRNLLLDQIFTS